MKKAILLGVALVMLQGCAFGVAFNPLQQVGIQTNLPLNRNGVVVTCPTSKLFNVCELRKFDSFTSAGGRIIATLKGGDSVSVPFSGFFGDQRMALKVRAMNEKDEVVGMSTRVFMTNDYNTNSGDVQMWDISRAELEQGGR